MKIGIIGLGYVGASVAVTLLHEGLPEHLLLHDLRHELAEGEALDLAHGAPFYPGARVEASAIEDMRACDAVVVCAGAGGSPTESRLDLLGRNAIVARAIGAGLRGFEGVVVVVSNPVDVLTQIVAEASGLPPERVLGTGTMLDTARLRQMLGRELDIDSRSVHANVVGEHGDSEVVLWSSASIGGRPVRAWPGWEQGHEPRIADAVRGAAYDIIRRKGATNHAIGFVTTKLLRWILRGERRVLTVSRLQTGALGVDGVALSLPAVVGREGATQIVEPAADDREREALARSAEVLRAALGQARAALAGDSA